MDRRKGIQLEDNIFGRKSVKPIYREKQTNRGQKSSVWEVISHSYAKTFSSSSENIAYGEFNNLTPKEMVGAPLAKNESVRDPNDDRWNDWFVANPSDTMKEDGELMDEHDVIDAIQRYRSNPHIRFSSFLGLPNRLKINEVDGDWKVIWSRIFWNFLGIQEDVSTARRNWNIVKAIPYEIPKNLIVSVLKTARNIIKVPTQFLACVIADVTDYYAQLNKHNKGWTGAFGFEVLKGISLVAWGFELVYKSGLEPIKSVKDAFQFGRELAGPENPKFGYALGTLFALMSIASTIALAVATFGLTAKYSGIDIASHVTTELATTLSNLPVISQMTAFLTNALAYIGVTLPANIVAIPSLVALSTLGLTTVGTALDRLYEFWEHIWENKAPPPPPSEMEAANYFDSWGSSSRYQPEHEKKQEKKRGKQVDYTNKSKYKHNQFNTNDDLTPNPGINSQINLDEDYRSRQIATSVL